MICPLCKSSANIYHTDKHRIFYRCNECNGIFANPTQLPGWQEEKQRYTLHQNTPNDTGYLEFLSPIIHAVKRNHFNTSVGLDFGSGSTPVLSSLLQQDGFDVTPYDPIFEINLQSLTKTYHYIICCEVIEHFHHPAHEFKRLFELLKPGGCLYCMTDIYTDKTDFANWYYKNDTTHVFFYHEDTLNWILKQYGFTTLTINNRLIAFTK